MQLPGLPFNTAYIDNLATEIASVNACAALQLLTNDAVQILQTEIQEIENRIASLVNVIVPPHDLPSVIAWIQNQINPMIVAYETYAIQLTAAVAALARLVAAIQQAAASFTNCSIVLPVVGAVAVT